MFDQRLVAFSRPSAAGNSSVSLVRATVVVDRNEFVGVAIAARALADDIGRVSRTNACTVLERDVSDGFTDVQLDTAIIIGTTARSTLIQTLVDNNQINVDSIRGKWECYHITQVKSPSCIKGCRNALVIAGSDRRGAIYGAFTICEQIGVSPWHWWADVPVKNHDEIYALPTTISSKEPSVKYRGIFINDEAPALTGMVREKFGRYGKEFYSKVFDLLLRLRANFMWPAMWPGYPNPGSSFFVDDAENQKTAHDYGIVMSTSHHEPMQRATNEWFGTHPDGSWSWLENKEEITEFFKDGLTRAKGFDSYLTMGMRGEYDKAMKTDDPAAVVRDVIKTQRSLIREIYSQDDAVPQLLALYKEVQGYWDSGKLDVPDDVTLLFADDNFGSLRRLPFGDEVNRKGGAGIYYHFEYVGTPRSYKWINSNSLGKTWHQLQEAYRRNARQIWVFNVGDIKPLEVPITFAMSLAWDIDSIQADSFSTFYESLAEREFDSALAPSIAEIWREHDHLVSIRRHEHIEANNFSLLHYDEANTIASRWQGLLKTAEASYSSAVAEAYKPTLFELVLHPVKASAIYTTLRIKQAQNQLWASQRRNTANVAFREVLDLFDADFTLSEEFHSLLDGKWNSIMSQPHYGFNDTWHAPSRDMISGLCYVQSRQNSNPVVGQMGVAVEGHAGVRPGVCNEESDRTHPSRRDLVPGVTLGVMHPYGVPSRWFEIYSRGAIALSWSCSTPYDWIKLSQTSGRLVPGQPDIRVYITVDWTKVPTNFDEEVLIAVRSQGGNYGPYLDDFEQIHLPVKYRQVEADKFTGFVETDGYVSIPATAPKTLPDDYRILPEIGRLGSGSVAINPTRAENATEPSCLTYDAYVFGNEQDATLNLYFNMTLDLDPASLMQYDIGIDGGTMQRHRLVEDPCRPGELPPGWYHAVQDCVWRRKHAFGPLSSGPHSIKIRFLHSNIILEKVVLDLGGLKSSYLGPPPSRKI
ncbi:hypothetical protein ABEF93_007752 [Exophiala dermatitidis]